MSVTWNGPADRAYRIWYEGMSAEDRYQLWTRLGLKPGRDKLALVLGTCLHHIAEHLDEFKEYEK